MPSTETAQTTIQNTGTVNMNVPIDIYAQAVYRTPDGRMVTMPVGVTGRDITLQFQGRAQ